MGEVLELMMQAHLYREENRAGFLREDFPEMDNANNWLKWINIRREGTSLSITDEPVPTDKYSLKPKPEKTLHPIFKGGEGFSFL